MPFSYQDENHTFPPATWLGWGLNMLATTPADIDTVAASVLRAERLIKIGSNSTDTKLVNGTLTWAVPENVAATDQIANGQASYSTYEDGTKASSSITINVSLSAKYMSVQGTASVDYSISKMFDQSYSYALFSYNQTLVEAALQDWGDYINNKGIAARLKYLPKFDPTKKDVLGDYQRFFKTLGTHVITGTVYGGRFQLTAWASNSDSSVEQSFGADIAVEYNGLTNGGKLDSSIKGSSQYSAFSKSSQKTCSCQGGDPAIAGRISSSAEADGVYQDFEKWVATARTLPGIMSMTTTSLWDMMSASPSPDLYNRAQEIQDAFTWISEHPAKHETKCRFVINSDWGEIGLLTPSAFIAPDPASPPGADFLFSSTKISWGREQSHAFKRDVTCDFIIKNDGSPVDIMLSHGSDGSKGGNGECEVNIYNKTFQNTGVKDNNWNSKWFSGCEVDPIEL